MLVSKNAKICVIPNANDKKICITPNLGLMLAMYISCCLCQCEHNFQWNMGFKKQCITYLTLDDLFVTQGDRAFYHPMVDPTQVDWQLKHKHHLIRGGSEPLLLPFTTNMGYSKPVCASNPHRKPPSWTPMELEKQY